MKKVVLLIFLSLTILNAKVFFYENNKIVYLKKDNTIASTARVKYFKNRYGESIVVKNQILIKLKSIAVITALILEFDLEILKKVNNKKYIMRIKNIDDVFWISNEINNRTAVSYAYPVYLNKTKQNLNKNLNKK
ncbi:MAG: hypothetical protein U9O56_06540 [Campylobacterota bacterium]|nr:hypothetical protein [Campylobacterota bacterium]